MGVTVRYPTRMSLPLSEEDESYVKSTLDQIRKSGNRVNILFADPTQAAAFLFVASKEQMTGNGWLYIGTDWNSMQTYSGLDDEFRDVVKNAMNGMVGISPYIGNVQALDTLFSVRVRSGGEA